MEPLGKFHLKTENGEMIVVRKVFDEKVLCAVEIQNDTKEAKERNVKVYKDPTNKMAIVFITESEHYVLLIQEGKLCLQFLESEKDPPDHHFCFKWVEMGNFTFSGLATVEPPGKYIDVIENEIVISENLPCSRLTLETPGV